MIELEAVKPFIGSDFKREFCNKTIHLLGFPFDGTTSYRPGSRFGPDGLRHASYNLETYSPYLDRDTEDLQLVDLGNLNFNPSRFDLMIEEFNSFTKNSNFKNQRLITLGGEHSISVAPIKLHAETYPDMLLLHLDAHADLRDGYLGNANSHASIIRRALDFLKPDQILQYGIRSGTKEEFDWMKSNNTLATSLNELCERLEKVDDQRPIYLTLDLDYFDPSELPGTGTPEAGGETFHSFIKIIKILARKNFIGADIVELAPTLDSSGISSCMASKVVRETVLALKSL